MDSVDSFLPMLLSNNLSLYELNLAEKRPGAAVILKLAEALEHNTHLHVLDLSGNQLADADVFPIVVALRKNAGVRVLKLRGNEKLSDQTAATLIECIKSTNENLCDVDLEGTSVSETMKANLQYIMALNKFPRQFKPMVYRTKMNDESLFEFELTYDPSDVKVYNEESTKILVDAFKTNTTITSIKLNKCCRSEQCVAVLAPLLATNQLVKRVSLRQNMLGDESCRIIVEALKLNPNPALEDLDLGRNEIGDAGCAHLADFLEVNHTLRVVTLDHNDAACAAAKDRVRAGCALNCEPSSLKPLLPRLVANEPGMEVLTLVGSESSRRGPAKGYFTNLGARTVAGALHFNTVVHTLNFSNNHIGPDGAKAIGELLRKNSTITSVNLTSNPIFDEGVRHLIIAMQGNDVISTLNVDDTGCSETVKDELQALCHINAQPLPLKQCLLSPKLTGALDLSKRESQPLGKMGMLDVGSLKYVATILKSNSGITELDLTDNTIGNAGVQLVAEMLKSPKCPLVKVVLCNTGINDGAVDALTEAVRCNYVVRVIHTTGNLDCTFRPQSRLNDALSLNQFAPAVKDIVPLLQANVAGIRAVDFARSAADAKVAPLGDDTARILFHALRDNSHVTTVNLSNQGLSNRAVGYACECLAVNRTLTSVDLSRNGIGPDGATLFAELLEVNTTLRSLDLSGNNILESGGVPILQALRMSNRSLSDINVENCGIAESTANNIAALAALNGEPIEFRRQVLERLSALTEIDFEGSVSNGYLTDASCKALYLAFITQQNHVTSLRLNGHHITTRGLRQILKLLESNRSVVRVSLADNAIEGAEDLLEAFVLKCDHVLSFDVSGNKLGDARVARIGLLLRLNAESPKFRTFFFGHEKKRFDPRAPTARSLDLPRCGLKHSSIRLLTELLQASDLAHLTLIDVSNNELNDAALKELLSALEPLVVQNAASTCKLQALYLDGNHLSTDGAAALADFVWKCNSLLIASIDRNPVVSMEFKPPAAITALEGIATKLSENRKLVSNVEAVLASLHRNVGAAAGSGVAAVRLAERRAMRLAEDDAAGKQLTDDEVLRDALQHMPKRTPYVRGMYVAAATPQQQ